MTDLERDLVVDRNAKKRARHFECSVDRAFDKVIAGCQRQHGEHCWFYAPLTAAYRKIHAKNASGGIEGGVRMHSIEVWDKASGKLVAGELGYAIGGAYTSLSGFREPGSKSAGTIQCCCVAALLLQCGFKVWDLGMGMDYKKKLGAKNVPRGEFLQLLRSVRDLQVELEVDQRIECRTLLCNGVRPAHSAVSAEGAGKKSSTPSKKEAKRLRKKAAKAAARREGWVSNQLRPLNQRVV